ncbi:hypothetical protein E2C01_028109 [Portunus trituberculatus]|uniref:Uncharacterized protein n=1 Tax=Portunus trituberculatus TaxID=210409 RepID=A0A5B7EJM9_PORTR|nr:hypothetical protein [Portunus trituberculatus]
MVLVLYFSQYKGSLHFRFYISHSTKVLSPGVAQSLTSLNARLLVWHLYYCSPHLNLLHWHLRLPFALPFAPHWCYWCRYWCPHWCQEVVHVFPQPPPQISQARFFLLVVAVAAGLETLLPQIQ